MDNIVIDKFYDCDNSEELKWCDTEHGAMKKLKNWGLED